MRNNRPLAVLTALAVALTGLLVVGLGSFLDTSTAQPAVVPGPLAATAETDAVIRGELEDPVGNRVDNYQVQAIPVGGTVPAASAISYRSRFQLHVPAGRYRLVGVDLDQPARYGPLIRKKEVVVGSGEVGRVGVLELDWAAPVAVQLPRITGTPQVGAKLTALPGTWSRPKVKHGYVWLRGSVEVGTGDTYRPTYRDAGKRLTVRVSASAAGSEAGLATSTAVRVDKVIMKVTSKVRGKLVLLRVRVTGTLKLPIVVKEGTRTLARRTAAPAVKVTLRAGRGAHTYLVGPADARAKALVKVKVRVR